MSFEVDVRGAFRRGDSEGVLRMAGAEVERARAAGDPAGEVEALYAMGRVAIRGGDLARAGVFREGYDSFVPYVCVAAAALATAEGDHARAARMVGVSESAFAALGQVPDPDDAMELRNAREAAVQALGADRFEEERAIGAALKPADAFPA